MSVYQNPQIPVVQFPHWITAPGQCSPIKFHPGQLPPDFYPPDTIATQVFATRTISTEASPLDNFHPENCLP